MNQQQDTPQTERLSKAESARINGAKSKGAVTPEGKANSANGSLRHGAYSKRVLMDGESAPAYEFFKSTFVEIFQPVDGFEAECVDSMVMTRWRIRRLESAETSNLNHALLFNKEANAAKFDVLDVLHERGIAVQSQMPSIEANTRVEERLHRIYERNYKLLANYRRKSGRNMPPPDGPQTRPPATDPPPPAPTPALTEQPTDKPAAAPSTASVIKTAAMFLVIFALFLLITLSTATKTFAMPHTPPTLNGPADPSNSIRRQK